jgi:perosamine synthetase
MTAMPALKTVSSSSLAPEAAIYVVTAKTPLFAAIEQALDNAVHLCFVVDDAGKLLGQVTLPALRRAIIDGRYLTEQNIANFIEECPEILSEDLLCANTSVIAAPIVNAVGHLLSVKINQKASFVPVAEPILSHREFRYLMDAYLSTWISSTGDYIREFEKKFSARMGMQQGVATSNGTVSLHLALVALGIGPGDEVIVPDLTFAASANAVLYCGATPVLVDVDPVTWCLSAETFQKAITPKTRAVMPVHVFGRPSPMAEIAAVAEKHNIYVIEDCAEAHGAMYDGKYVGQYSHIASFSFFANKIITSGEGGMCITNHTHLADRMRMLRDHGMAPERRYWHAEVGFNYRMTNMQAAVGVAQLERIDEFLATRRALYKKYEKAMTGIPGFAMPPALNSRFEPVIWFVCATVPAAKRAELMAACKKENIDLRPFFNALSMMPAYKDYARPNPISARLSATGINLPTSHRIDDGVIDTMATIFRRVLSA